MRKVSKMTSRPRIEIHPKGSRSRRIAADIEAVLNTDGQIDVEVVRYKQFAGLETLLITIVGGIVANVASHLLIRLCETAKSEDIKIQVVVLTEGKSKSFQLPEEKQACLEAATDESQGDEQT